MTVVIALAASVTLAMDPRPAGLTILIRDVRSPDGLVRVGLFDNAESFPRGDAVARDRVEASMGMVVLTFPNLPAGRYALAFYHDENSNSEFDKTLLGLPDEGFGFSNDAPVGFGPPSFADAAVDFDGTDLIIMAGMRYF